MRTILAILSCFLLSSCAVSQTSVLTKSVLQEMDYFDSFMNKFSLQSSEHVYVLRIDTSSGARQSQEHLFLLSSIYSQFVYEYINPKYAFKYKSRLYLVKTEIEIDFENVSEVQECADVKQSLNTFFDENAFLESNVIPPFGYCFFFKSYSGEVTGGMSIGSCEPYMNSSENDIFFYSNEDIERVEGIKY